MFNNNAVQSGLITGKEWDTTLKYIEIYGNKNGEEDNINVNSKGWGNYKDSSIILDKYKMYRNSNDWIIETEKKEGEKQLLRTGSSTKTKVLNISDMAGNLEEWTSSYYSYYGPNKYYVRGGGYTLESNDSYAKSSSYRQMSNGKDDNYFFIGYRTALYIK